MNLTLLPAHLKSFSLTAVLLLTSACAGAMQYVTLEPVAAQPKLRAEGSVTLYNTAAGSQEADFTYLFAELYGARVEVLGPAGTPLLYATLGPGGFEAYSVPERALIRDSVPLVMQRSERSMISLVSMTLGAVAAYATGFAEGTVFEAPERKPWGFLFQGDGPLAGISVRWIDTSVVDGRAQPQSLEQVVLDTGFNYIYVDKQEDGSFRVHFGDLNPILDFHFRTTDTHFSLQGIQWQLHIPPGSDVYSFAQYLARQR